MFAQRTFPKERAAFQRMVDERGARLRELRYEELRRMAKEPTEHVEVEGRRATIDLIVLEEPDLTLKICLQGFMPAKWFPRLKSVALDGFYKHPDERISPFSRQDYYQFD